MADPLYELFAFALDLYRAPLRFLPYVEIDRPIPSGFDALLKALNKQEESEFWHDLSERLKASPEQLRSAGFFLVKRLLFAEGGDHYRVLGLDSSADIARTRERYRLLMALFHPDRKHRGGEWTEQYAPRINEAYNTLKNPRKTRAYDRHIQGGDHWGDEVPPPGGAGQGEAGRRPGAELADRETPRGEGGVVRVPSKRPALHIWVGVVLLGLIGWFSVQVYESGGLKLAARGSGKAVSDGKVVVSVPAVEQVDNPSLRLVNGKGEEALGEGIYQEPQRGIDRGARPQAGAQTAAAAAAVETTAAAQGDGGVPAQEIREAGADPGEPAGSGQPSHSAGDAVALGQAARKPSADAKAEPDATPEPAESGDASGQGDSPAKKKPVIGQRDIDFLVSRFIQAYEAGDIGRFVGLFGKEARGNDGIGRERIAEQYGDLFRTTRRRSMMIRDVMWAPKADGVVRISFFVAIQTERHGSAEIEEYVGDVDLLVSVDREKLKIAKFTHHVRKR